MKNRYRSVLDVSNLDDTGQDFLQYTLIAAFVVSAVLSTASDALVKVG
jgi:hypothetical protein